MAEKGRYDFIPLSDKTKEGMRLSIDDLKAISVLLTLQDNAYDEQFEKIFKEIREIKEKVNAQDKEIATLKILNTWWAFLIRIAIGVGIALGFVRLLHGKF